MSIDSLFPSHEVITTASICAGTAIGTAEGLGKKVEQYKGILAIPTLCGFVYYGGITHAIAGAGVGGLTGIAIGAYVDSKSPVPTHEGKFLIGCILATIGATISASDPAVRALVFGAAPTAICYFGAKLCTSKLYNKRQ